MILNMILTTVGVFFLVSGNVLTFLSVKTEMKKLSVVSLCCLAVAFCLFAFLLIKEIV